MTSGDIFYYITQREQHPGPQLPHDPSKKNIIVVGGWASTGPHTSSIGCSRISQVHSRSVGPHGGTSSSNSSPFTVPASHRSGLKRLLAVCQALGWHCVPTCTCSAAAHSPTTMLRSCPASPPAYGPNASDFAVGAPSATLASSTPMGSSVGHCGGQVRHSRLMALPLARVRQ